MQFYSADDYGAYGRAKEEATQREANRFFALAQADAAARERAIASANEADRFAFQAAARDAQLMEDRNRFQLQQALQERDREERRGDVLFNRRLMLGQEGREQARLNLAERRFKADEDAFNKQLERESKLEGQEGEAIVRGYMETVPKLKSFADQLEGLQDTEDALRKEAADMGLVLDRQKGFIPPSMVVDPVKLRELQLKAQDTNRELTRLAALRKAAAEERVLLLRRQDALNKQAGRLGAVITDAGLQGPNVFVPFLRAPVVEAPAPAPAVPMAAAPPAPATNWIDAVSPSGRPYRVQR